MLIFNDLNILRETLVLFTQFYFRKTIIITLKLQYIVILITQKSVENNYLIDIPVTNV